MLLLSKAFVTTLSCSISFLKIFNATFGLTLPQVKKSKLITALSGKVWKLKWLSDSNATRVKPCGSNLCEETFKISTFAAFAIL